MGASTKRPNPVGITIRKDIGLGDALQFSSLPENYFNFFGDKLVDVSRPWFFDHNPFVDRAENRLFRPEKHELCNFPKVYEWPRPRDQVYLCNAEIHAARFGINKITLCRPRLYMFEKYPYELRRNILLHFTGVSHGKMPKHITDHVLEKYGVSDLMQIGLPNDPKINPLIPFSETKTLWDLAQLISKAKMLICVDSGPSWIAACYPDVIIKKVRTIWPKGYRDMEDWVPLEVNNVHSHWDDRAFQIYNTTESDIGFTQSYRKI